MRLGDFILANVEPILVEWEGFARSLTPGLAMGVIALRDHAKEILLATAEDMRSLQTVHEQSEKSKGLGGGGAESDGLDRASIDHALARLGSGFNLLEVVAEYRALRASVLRLWRDSIHGADEGALGDMVRFNESMDQSLAEAVKSYSQRVDESRELFLATLGHDLRTPLNAIMISAGLLAQSGQLDEENTEVARQMEKFGKVMSVLISDLLDFTRTRLGAGLPVAPRMITLESLCRDVLDESRAAHPDRTLRLDCVGDTSGEWDPARLRQVLGNLVANAVEHGADGEPVDVSVRSEGSDVIVEIGNQGAPIAASALPTLFDPFVRATAATGDVKPGRIGGVGLGLYIAREVVMAHGGSINVDSSDVTGTIFRVRLPRNHQTDQTGARSG